jgi:two-component system sensor histidine kinase/response regulator
MNIAQRLALLLAVPLVTLVGFGVFMRIRLAEVERHSRFVSESRIDALVTLGNLSRSFTEMRVEIRGFLLATTADRRQTARARLDEREAEVRRLLADYEQRLVYSETGRRLLGEFRTLHGAWLADARTVMQLIEEGRNVEAAARLEAGMAMGDRLATVLRQWIANNDHLAAMAGADAVHAIEVFRDQMLLAVAAALLFTGLLGHLTFRRIIRPIHALESAVRAIAAGDYARGVPFTQAPDETGGLARSIEVLKQGAARTDDQARQLQRQAGELHRINLLSDTALDLTKANYWHLSFDEPEYYYTNERGARLLGQDPVPNFRYPLADWEKQARLGDPVAAEGAIADFAAAVASRNQHYNTTYAFKRPVDGRVIWLHSSGHVIRDAEGRPREIFGVNQDITETKLAELAVKEGERQLRVTEQYFRNVLERAPDGLMVVDADGTIHLANAQCEKLFGYPREELVGQKVEMLVPAASRSFHPGLREGYHDAPTPRAMGAKRELHAQRKDGSLFPVDIGLSPLPTRDGAGTQVAVSIRDITERRQEEQERSYRLTFQRALLDTIPYPMFFKDAQGRFVGCNKAYEREFSTTAEILNGKTVLDLDYLPEEARRRFHEEDMAVIREAGRRSYELPIVFADGKTHSTLYSVDGFKLSDGTPGGLIGLLVDISDRKQAEQALREANFLSDIALELTKSGYWRVDYGDPEHYYQSERAARIVGEEPKPDGRYHLQREWFSRLIAADPALAEQTARIYQHAIDGRTEGYDAIYPYKRPGDGSIVWLHAAGRLERDPDGKARYMYGVYQDITEFRRMQDELRAAKQKAEEATQMKSMFLANMSHEIRTPMNAIIGLSYLALKTPLNAKQRDYIGKVHNAGTSLLAVINDILDFSKIEAGRLDLEEVEFKLDDVISSVTTVTAQKANEKGLEFLARLAPGLPPSLIGDPLRLGQVLINLVNNSVKFTERGEIRLTVDQVERTGDKCQLRFSVQDTGSGMTSEQSEKLFQPFTQADMSITRKHGGTGLGLTICRRLVELMGGQIWLESEVGAGTTFTFTVWLGIGSQSGPRKVIPERLTRLRALIVDDNAAAREIVDGLIHDIVKHVDSVASGAEALSAVRQNDAQAPYDVVFMDWRMPGMDGLQAARAIKSDPTLRHPPAIIMVTAFGREEVRDEAERLDLDGFLVKPVTKSMIVDSLVNAFLNEGETAAATTEAVQDGVSLAGLRVLLVEDNEINQQIAVELLEGVGATVTVSNHGGEALETLTGGDIPPPYDVVLMDLQMPVMDGHQATARIRADTRLAALPVIAMTAHATMEERDACLSAGMNGHISKPIDPPILFETLARLMRRTGTAAPFPQGPAERPEPLPEISGLDTADGLARVAGNTKLYLKLLRQFAEQQADVVARITATLDAGDRGTAERLAHTLKGVAGSLGAGAVQAAAGALEKVIRDSAPRAEVKKKLKHTDELLTPLLARLHGAWKVPAAPASRPVKVADAAAVRMACSQLLKLLEDFDPMAVDFIVANEAALRAAVGERNWPVLRQHVEAYAFEEARVLLPPDGGESRPGTSD